MLSYKHNDNIYLNVVFSHSPPIYSGTNPTIIINEEPEIADYNVTKTLPLLDKASDYFASVIRFDIPLSEIPIMVMPIIPNQADNDKTPFIIGILENNVHYQYNIEYISDNTLNGPLQNQSTQVITPYYYCYTYQVLLNMLNATLGKLYIDSGLSVAWTKTQSPFFYLNPVTQLISLVVYQGFTTIIAPIADVPSIYINEPLVNYLNSFELSFQGYNKQYGEDYVFILTGNVPKQAYYLPGTDPYTTTPTYYEFIEQYNTLQYWSSLRKLVITTNTIPINNEFVPSGILNSGISTGQPILTDFVPNIEFSGQSRAIAYYNPTSQYRLVDLISDIPLQKIDLRINWQDILGNLYPLYISLFQQASLKIAFIRKDLYHGSNILLNK